MTSYQIKKLLHVPHAAEISRSLLSLNLILMSPFSSSPSVTVWLNVLIWLAVRSKICSISKYLEKWVTLVKHLNLYGSLFGFYRILKYWSLMYYFYTILSFSLTKYFIYTMKLLHRGELYKIRKKKRCRKFLIVVATKLRWQ